jgi:hypothetical protein
MKARILVVPSLCAMLPATALPQALTSLASVRVGYVTRKNTVTPQDELKTQIDALDAQIAEARPPRPQRRAAPPVCEGHHLARRAVRWFVGLGDERCGVGRRRLRTCQWKY